MSIPSSNPLTSQSFARLFEILELCKVPRKENVEDNPRVNELVNRISASQLISEKKMKRFVDKFLKRPEQNQKWAICYLLKDVLCAALLKARDLDSKKILNGFYKEAEDLFAEIKPLEESIESILFQYQNMKIEKHLTRARTLLALVRETGLRQSEAQHIFSLERKLEYLEANRHKYPYARVSKELDEELERVIALKERLFGETSSNTRN